MAFKHYDDIEEFDRLYRSLLSDRSNREAYLKVEQRYKDRFGKRRYSSYTSFKVAYSNRIKSKRC